MMPTTTCDVCHKTVVDGLRSWRRHLPGFDRVGVCAPCSYRLSRTADGRGVEGEDMLHMVSVYRTLAGEVWSDGDRIFWFRAPFVHRKAAKIADLLDRPRAGPVPARATKAVVRPRGGR